MTTSRSTSARGGASTGTRGRASGREPRPAYECDACGHQPPKWVGRCPECGEWGSVVESTITGPTVSGRVVSSRMPAEPARPIATISAAPA
ncbi:DNA repair protein RadA, partial [Micromonospora azadirachtae]